MSLSASSKTQSHSDTKLNLQSDVLLCDQIADYYREEIGKGVYRTGDHLPTCREAGKIFGVSAQTVNRAFDILVEEDLVSRRRSVGTVVTLGKNQKQFTRSPRSSRQMTLPICQILRVSSITEQEADLFYDYQAGLTEGFDVWKNRFEIAYLKDDQPDIELLKMLVEEKQVRGLVAFALPENADQYLIESGFPVVFLGHNHSVHGAAGVIADRIGGYCEAWKYVDQLGHREVGFFGMGGENFKRRYRECSSGYVFAHPHARLSSQINAPVNADSETIQKILIKTYGSWASNSKTSRWPTLFFTQTDVIATKLLHALRGCGIRVPEDISVIGFNDAQIAKLYDPALTTLAVPRYEMALAASRILLDILADRSSAKGFQQIFPVRLVQRESCKQV